MSTTSQVLRAFVTIYTSTVRVSFQAFSSFSSVLTTAISQHKALHSSKNSVPQRNSCLTPSGFNKTKRSTTPTATANTPAVALEKLPARPPPPPPHHQFLQAPVPPGTHANRPPTHNNSKFPAIQANRTPLSAEPLSLLSAPRRRTMSCRRTGIRTYSR